MSLTAGFCLLTYVFPATAQVNEQKAAAYMAEVEALCEREGGRLWGVSLCGPVVMADPASGTIATNRPEPDAPRPRALGFANAAMQWGDDRWAAFVWPLIPAASSARSVMFLHELFHRVQPGLGLYVAASSGENDHLNTPEGRYWMQLEWRALARALETSGSVREEAVRDALAFRMARRAAFPAAAEREAASEINEGLAQYTGTVAAARRFATIAGHVAMPPASRRIWRRAVTGRHLTVFTHMEWVTRTDAVSPSW